MTKPYLSVVIPIYNEADNLVALFSRLNKVLIDYDRLYEVIFVNDGSRDDSAAILNALYKQHPKQVRVIHFSRNFGQHMAIIAGFEQVRGEVIVTLDADLQNPPEEIPKLVRAIEIGGYDYIGGVRKHRQDRWFRRYASKLNNYIRAKITGIVMVDQGSMLRAYKRHVIDLMLASKESSVFIPALAYHYASRPFEIEVEHRERAAGKSKYSLYQLLRLNFDLMTGFSLIPLQVFTLFGILIALLSAVFVVFLLIRRLVIGPEVQGVFTLFAILYFLVGVALMGLGIIGEYIGRIYKEVRKRPRFVIREIVGGADEK